MFRHRRLNRLIWAPAEFFGKEKTKEKEEKRGKGSHLKY